jgi:hypothetical protein
MSTSIEGGAEEVRERVAGLLDEEALEQAVQGSSLRI